MAQVIQLRRDTKANWEQYDPIIAAGEIAVQTDTYQIKTGDGLKKWSELPFVSYGLLDDPEGWLDKKNVTNMVYDDSDLLTEIDYETGNKALFTYDTSTSLLQKVEYTKEDGSTVFYEVDYTYDSDNNLITVTRSYK
jgi:hypothetical protein